MYPRTYFLIIWCDAGNFIGYLMSPCWRLLLIAAVAIADRHDSSSLYSISSEFSMDTAEANCEDEWYLCELRSAGW